MTLEVAGTAAALAALVVLAVAIGLIGRRRRSLRVFVPWVGVVYSVALFVYFVFEGAGSQCAGSGATFHCWEVTYASRWGLQGSLAVAVLMLLSFAPVVSAMLRNRIPSVVAAVAMPVVIATYLVGLLAWAPAWAAALAAAVAGPPSLSPEPSPEKTADVRA
jgi:hypothetical protein